MRVKKASPFGVFPLIKGLATNISFKKKHDKQCRPNDYLGIWGGFLNFTHFGMWRVPIIFHHPQLPYIYQTYWRLFKAWWYTSVWAEDIWYTYNSYTIQSILQISKKQKRDKRRKTQERCGVLLIRLFSSWTSGAVWQVSAWLSEGKHIRYNNFLGVSNDHTLFIHVNSTTSERLSTKNATSEVRVFETKAGAGETSLCSISPQFWHSSKTMQNLYTKVYGTSWKEDPVLPCIEDPPM